MMRSFKGFGNNLYGKSSVMWLGISLVVVIMFGSIATKKIPMQLGTPK
jgi:hypothetical protein